MQPAPIDKCPFCDSDEGYYSKDYVKGSTIWRHNFDGAEADNGDYYEGLSHRRSKYAYCLSCNKRLFKIATTV